MDETQVEVRTFGPAGSCCGAHPAFGPGPSAPAPSRTVDISAQELRRCIELALASVFLDPSRLEKSLRQARAGQYRPLTEVLANASRQPDARSRGGSVRA